MLFMKRTTSDSFGEELIIRHPSAIIFSKGGSVYFSLHIPAQWGSAFFPYRRVSTLNNIFCSKAKAAPTKKSEPDTIDTIKTRFITAPPEKLCYRGSVFNLFAVKRQRS
jgi:hypothetical protein